MKNYLMFHWFDYRLATQQTFRLTITLLECDWDQIWSQLHCNNVIMRWEIIWLSNKSKFISTTSHRPVAMNYSLSTWTLPFMANFAVIFLLNTHIILPYWHGILLWLITADRWKDVWENISLSPFDSLSVKWMS